MKNYLITEEIANALLQYLGTRPFAEVNNLIQALQTVTPAPEAPSPKQEKAEKKREKRASKKK